MTKAILAAMAAIAMCALAVPARAADDCPAATVTVQSAKKFVAPKADGKAAERKTDGKEPDEDVVQLGDTIEVTMTGLPELLAEADCRKAKGLPKRTVVLFLAAQPMKGITGYLPGEPKDGKMLFDLIHGAASKTAWAFVLVSPSTMPDPLKVSVGYDDAYPFGSNATISFRKLAVVYAWLSVFFVVGLLLAFLYLMWFTGICREGKPTIPPNITDIDSIPPRTLGPFSLSKVQAAIWFFVIIGSYLLIVSVTHDISGTVNTTALTLMGIGAATIVGSAAISTNQGQASNADDQAAAASQLAQQMKELKASLAAKRGTPEAKIIRQSLTDTEFAFKRATNQSSGLWRDIISDANGVNFHRFQMAAWTVVLAAIFVIAVTRILAMPDFDNTLLALQGLSAGTFLGLKITEPKVTAVPEKPKAADETVKPEGADETEKKTT